MAKLCPEDKAPPREAWAMRLFLLAIVLFGGLYILTDSSRSRPADMLTRWLADRVRATGEIKVAGQSDERVQAAFQKVQSQQSSDAILQFLSSDGYGRKYAVSLTAPDRDQALAQLESLFSKFGSAYGGDVGRDLWLTNDPAVPPVESPEVVRRRHNTVMGLLLSSLAALAGGLWLYWQTPAAARDRMRRMLLGPTGRDPGDDRGRPRSASDDSSHRLDDV